jgi:hypothetical protein
VIAFVVVAAVVAFAETEGEEEVAGLVVAPAGTEGEAVLAG